MAGKKTEKLDGRLETLEERIESMQGELGNLRKGISKILASEQEIVEILARLNAMAPSLRDLGQSPTGVVGRHKSIVTCSTLGQSNAEKEEDEGISSKEYEGKNEFRTKRVKMPPLEGSDPNKWLSRAKIFFKLNRMSEMEKMDAIKVNMEGDALAWNLY